MFNSTQPNQDNQDNQDYQNYQEAFHVFKSSLEHYLKTGIGEKEYFFSFITKYEGDIQQETDIHQWLHSIFPAQIGFVPLFYQSIDTNVLQTSLDILSKILKIFPQKQDNIFRFLIHENFNYHERPFEHSAIFRLPNTIVGLNNTKIGFEKVIEFKKKENLILNDASTKRLMRCVVKFLIKNQFFFDKEETNISLPDKELGKKMIGDTVYLYAYHFLVREIGALEEFKKYIKEELVETPTYGELVEVILEKASIDFFSPQKDTHNKDTLKFKI